MSSDMLIRVKTDQDVKVTNALINAATSEAIKQAVVDALHASPAFKKRIEEIVREEVRIQAPGNPRIAMVIKEVQDHLDRYPSIAHDQGLQDAVGKAIFDYFQKTL